MHKGKALIHILANEGNHILLERALKACKDPIDLEIEDLNGQTALNIAARNGHIEIVKLLLDFKQPMNDGTGRIRTIDVNHADRDGWTPLRYGFLVGILNFDRFLHGNMFLHVLWRVFYPQVDLLGAHLGPLKPIICLILMKIIGPNSLGRNFKRPNYLI